MLTLPEAIINLLNPFSVVFHGRTWRKTQILLVGTILAPGKRTVTSVLRIMGLCHQDNFALYHQVVHKRPYLLVARPGNQLQNNRA